MAETQSWRVSVLVSAVGVLGTLLGFFLQYSLNRDSERRSAIEQRRIALEQLQSTAYVAFQKAFDKDRMARQEKANGNKKIAEDLEREYQLEAGAAIRNIALYGDERVVAAVAEWYRHDPRLPPCGEERSYELKIWTRMRESLRLVPTVNDADVAAIAGICRLEGSQKQ
jgi:hypothetical protein